MCYASPLAIFKRNVEPGAVPGPKVSAKSYKHVGGVTVYATDAEANGLSCITFAEEGDGKDSTAKSVSSSVQHAIKNQQQRRRHKRHAEILAYLQLFKHYIYVCERLADSDGIDKRN